MQMRMVLLDLSAKDVADLSGLNPATISNYLRRERWPDPDNLNRIAKALSCSIPELLAPPIAQDRPNFAQAWKVMSEFMESLTPARRRLLDSTDKMPEQQLIGLANLADGIRRASASADGIHPVPTPVDMLKALAALGDPRFAGLTRMSQAQLESLAFIVSHAGDNLPSGQADHAKKKTAKGKERA